MLLWFSDDNNWSLLERIKFKPRGVKKKKSFLKDQNSLSWFKYQLDFHHHIHSFPHNGENSPKIWCDYVIKHYLCWPSKPSMINGKLISVRADAYTNEYHCGGCGWKQMASILQIIYLSNATQEIKFNAARFSHL